MILLFLTTTKKKPQQISRNSLVTPRFCRIIFWGTVNRKVFVHNPNNNHTIWKQYSSLAAIEGWDFSPLSQFAHFVHLALGQGSDPERFNIGESLNSLILQSHNSALVFPNPLKLSEESVVRLRKRLFALNSSSSSSTSQKRVWKLTLRHADSHLNMKYLLIYL